MITPEVQLAAARDTIRSMEEQLVDLYAEKEQAGEHEATIRRLSEMVESLNAQVCDLLDQRSGSDRQAAAAAAAARAPRPVALAAA